MIITGRFSSSPAGFTGSRPDEQELETVQAGVTGSSPTHSEYDAPRPGGRT